jgi:hypothetical protein
VSRSKLVVYVVKASGETEPLDLNKVRRACLRTGAPPETAREIVREVSKLVYDGISTRDIYRMVYELLKKRTYSSAMKFSLKEAIMKMGPSGFPFETYVSEILKHHGYRTRTGVILKGACVNHEIDIIVDEGASANSRKYMVECKYHNSSGIYTGLKETLYTYARLLDLREGYENGICEHLDGAWLVTNTKISEEAKTYSRCRGLQLIGWGYPPKNGLEKLIEEKNLYPITILESMSEDTFKRFSEAGLIVAKDLQTVDIKTLSNKTRIPYTRLAEIRRNMQWMEQHSWNSHSQ